MNHSALLDRHFYHGSPSCIEQFSYDFADRGRCALGGGFYFINTINEARHYCEFEEGKKKFLADLIQPTIHKVKLDFKNPLIATQVHPLSEGQVREIIQRSPVLDQSLTAFGDVEFEGRKTLMKYAMGNRAGNDEDPLLRTLNMLATDFYQEHIEAFNIAVREVVGYDGLLSNENGHWIAVAWFPEQIKIVERIPYRVATHDRDGGLTP